MNRSESESLKKYDKVQQRPDTGPKTCIWPRIDPSTVR